MVQSLTAKYQAAVGEAIWNRKYKLAGVSSHTRASYNISPYLTTIR
jgi:hypothetical protein